MKLSTSIWAFVLLVLFLMGCAKKPVYTCGTVLTNKPSIESKVLSLKTVGIADTITAFVSGTIFGKDSIDKKVTIDTLSFATITLINKERQDTIKVVSDAQGKFQQHFQAGTYDILVKYVAYTGLMIKNVPFGRGELKEFNALLGQQGQTIVESKVDANK